MPFALSSSSPSSSALPLLPSRGRPTKPGTWWNIKAMAAGSRDNLDHLQRPGKQQLQSQPLKRRTSSSPPIGLWDRFPTARTIQQMMDTMERIMEDPFAYTAAPLASPVASDSAVEAYRRGRTPWEIKEGEGEYKMRFDMPGMTKKDVKLWVQDKMLVIKAEKMPKRSEEGKETKEGEEEEDWSAVSYGRYNSRIALPENVAVEKIKAEVKDGVLYITIPKVSTEGKILDIHVQ
ncbi:hypothetical protein Cni_G20276 [Canna indica]|uniref:SHSP domain-containing protein n=1 Tax=Canna indica TaxID=4628 RepID=A0AAQ3KR09_9LILI|nr:hypothetical protein Cni_G20276 [Canna indica]